MSTPYSKENAKFSLLGHNNAIENVYPYFFNQYTEKFICEDTTTFNNPGDLRSKIYDGEMARDCVFLIKKDSFLSPIQISFQERFRRIKYLNYQDLTITEHNNITNIPSELHKLSCDFMLYGYYNDINNIIEQCVIIDIPRFKLKLINGELIGWNRNYNTRTEQKFITVKFDILKENDLILWEYNPKQKYSIVDRTPKLSDL